ncbi:MAG TPA: aminodeoxychorismate/anthranilate synthase component II [Burkholderiales bacterium]|nr:aminodeoxychorismate/anthranilate synthase component II [Burkholderiales bacterium]
MILLIDNYDSFVYNLARYFENTGFNTQIVRNDKITIEEIKQLNPSHIVLSPGPCSPNEAGISLQVVTNFYNKIPMLGVCLGHQIIAQAFGAKITRAKYPMHGKSSLISHNSMDIFNDIPNPLKVGRYHSLIVTDIEENSDLLITAKCFKDEIMALKHKRYNVFGVQFHPEAILTEYGMQIIKNFIK